MTTDLPQSRMRLTGATAARMSGSVAERGLARTAPLGPVERRKIAAAFVLQHRAIPALAQARKPRG